MRSVIVFAVLALAASVVVPQYATNLRTKPAPVALAARPDSTPPSGNSRSMVVSRNAHGHFVVDGRVDGRQLSFVVDTGASAVAITASDAARLGFHPAQREFTVDVKTANGSVRAAPAQLDMVEVGDLTVRDVVAIILPDQALRDNLLGLSFLSRLRRFEYSDGRLVLEQ